MSDDGTGNATAPADSSKLTAEIARILVSLPGLDMAKLPVPIGNGAYNTAPVTVPTKAGLHFLTTLTSLLQGVADAASGVQSSVSAEVASAADDLAAADLAFSATGAILKPDWDAVQAAIKAKQDKVSLPVGFYTRVYAFLQGVKSVKDAYDKVSDHWFVGSAADKLLGLTAVACTAARDMITIPGLVPQLYDKLGGASTLKTAAIIGGIVIGGGLIYSLFFRE